MEKEVVVWDINYLVIYKKNRQITVKL